FVFDVTAACSGFVFALSTAEKFIQSGLYQKGLVIGAETFSKTIDWSDRRTAVLFGDGAGGVLLEASDKAHSDGSRGDGLTSGVVGLNSPFSVVEDNLPYVTMDGRAIFDFTIRDVSKSIAELIESSNFTADSIDYLLLHQANIRILDKMAKKIGVDREK
ncbi:3-oxoacyl-[acyl-carrier-protein] synthase III C-terminal domain-containing protein, partial [Streptococcus suis]